MGALRSPSTPALPSMQIFVKTQVGRTIITPAEGEETVRSLKRRIEDTEGIPECEQRLVFAGKQLENSRTLSESHVGEESTLQLVLWLRAGRRGVIDAGDGLALRRTDSTMLGTNDRGEVVAIESPRTTHKRQKLLRAFAVRAHL